MTEAFRITDTAALIGATGATILAAGIPLWRLAYFQFTLHPELGGKSYTWRRGAEVTVGSAGRGLLQEQRFRDSPMLPVFEEKRAVRYRLGRDDFSNPVLQGLKAEGATDYVALPLVFSTGHVDGLSVVSDAPGGFSRDDLDRMYLLQFAFTRIVETHSLRDTATYLLDAYVGRAAGERILAGDVLRGGGETLEAVIWYCDLRGFTDLSEHLARDSIIALLNDYFGAVGGAVTEAGGEILKFIGDAMLAIFPVANDAARAEVVGRAVQAATRAVAAIAALNDTCATTGQPPIRFGLALHLGDVMFGNIGASARLDFTVIGPAVNEAARIELLCKELGHPLLVSSTFARAATNSSAHLVSTGRHRLRGVREEAELFTLNPNPRS